MPRTSLGMEFPLTRLLRDAVGLPVFVENRVRTFGQAEMWFGMGRGTGNTTIVLLNTGTSAAIFVTMMLIKPALVALTEFELRNSPV